MKKLLPLFMALILLTGCGETEPVVTETTPAETTSDDRFLLVRGWTGEELLGSIFFCGEYRPLPFDPAEYPDFSLSGETLLLPDGSSAEAVTDENGAVTGLRFRRETAPADFSVYGAGFDAAPEDIPSSVGIANSVYGSEETTLTYSFYQGGITELTFVFTERTLTEIFIMA